MIFQEILGCCKTSRADFISLRPGSLGARGVNASLPQAPSLAAEVAHRYGARVILYIIANTNLSTASALLAWAAHQLRP